MFLINNYALLYVLVINCQVAVRKSQVYNRTERETKRQQFNGTMQFLEDCFRLNSDRASNWQMKSEHTQHQKKKTFKIKMFNTNLWFKLKRKQQPNSEFSSFQLSVCSFSLVK